MATAGAQHFVECDDCDTRPAQYYCLTCPGNLCDICHDKHVKHKLSKEHQIQPLSRKSIVVKFGICKEHEFRKIEFFCKYCQLPLCSQCLVEKHNGHELDDIHLIYKACLHEARKRLVFIDNELIPTYEKLLSETEEQESDLEEDSIRLQKEMNIQTETMINLIRTIEDDFNISLKKSYEKEKEAVHSRQGIIRERLSKLRKIKENISRYSFDILYKENTNDLEKLCRIPDSVSYTSPTFSPGKFQKDIIARQYGKITAFKSPRISIPSYSIKQKKPMTSPSQTACLVTNLNKQYQVKCASRTYIAVSGFHSDIRILGIDGIQQKVVHTDAYNCPAGIAVMNDESIVYVDNNRRRVVKVTNEGKLCEIITSDWHLSKGICLTKSGHILLCLVSKISAEEDDQNGKVVKYSMSGDVMREFISKLYKRPNFITENKANQDIIVSDYTTNQLIAVNEEGEDQYTYDGGVFCRRVEKFCPKDLDSDFLGHVIVADLFNHSVHMLSMDGEFLSFILTKKNGLTKPIGICFYENDSLLIAEASSSKVKCFKYLQ